VDHVAQENQTGVKAMAAAAAAAVTG